MGDNNYLQAVLNKASKDKFILTFDTPPAFKQHLTKFHISKDTVNRDRVQMSIAGTIVPEISVPNVIMPYAGQSLKVSSHTREPYEDLTIDFAIDNQFQNYWTIYRWLDLLNDEKYSYYDQSSLGKERTNYMKNYQTDFSISVLDEYNVKIIDFVYTMCFPTHLGKLEYDYKNHEQLNCSFTFSFSQLLVKLPVS